jgi:GntR family transcriptional repressor for pyruvate dehydrogenase complex
MTEAMKNRNLQVQNLGSVEERSHRVPTPAIRRDHTFALKPPARTTLAQQVADQIETLILTQGRKPNIRLPSERVLEKQLGVSRIVIREAMKQLVERGLIEIESGRGTFVVPVTAKAMSKSFVLFLQQNDISYAALFQVRRVLEGEIAALAARCHTADSVSELHRNIAEMELATREIEEGNGDRVEEFACLDLEFHHLLTRATGNPLFEFILQPVTGPLLQVRRVGALVLGAARKATEQHARILKAIQSRQEETAREEMLSHLNYVEQLLDEKGPQRWQPET